MRSPRVIALSGLLAMLSSACAIDEQTTVTDGSTPSIVSTVSPATSPSTSQAATDSSNPEAPSIPAAYDWTAPLVGGGLLNLAGYSNKAVVLWFWAPY